MFYIVRYHIFNKERCGPYIVGTESGQSAAEAAARDFASKHPPQVNGLNAEVKAMTIDEFRAARSAAKVAVAARGY